jgi:uncharacterized protein YdeI (YjbR/CyaY-like superfamily)
MTVSNQPELLFASQAAWEKWLDKNHDKSDGVWLKFAKKNSGVKSVNYTEALDVALCYGWIDSQTKSLDEKFYLQKFTPRRSKSVWSKINVGKIEQLMAEGRMKPAGLMQVEAAKADGRWEGAYEPQSRAVPPVDFQTALDKNPKARDFYNSLNSANRYAFLFRLRSIKNPKTRNVKIASYIEMLENQQKFHA